MLPRSVRCAAFVVFLGAPVCGLLAQGAPRPSRYSPAELKSVGEAVVEAQIASYSKVSNAEWERDVDLVLRRLVAGAALPEGAINWVIVGNSQINAAAAPGGYMIINAGLLETFGELARRESPTDSVRRRELYLAYVASVLSHELAHHALGHTDEIVERARGLQRRFARDTINRTQGRMATLLRDSLFLSQRRHGRGLELEADRAGALFMLRAGWEMQHAMDLFRWLDLLERENGAGRLQNVTWLRSHPRSSEREAALEGYRAHLKLHQATFDDALTLIENNVMLDSAIAMLDRVLADLPGLLPAKHARAAAIHRQWLNGVAVQQLKVRGSVPTYNVRFVSIIRGPLGSPLLLQRARQAYAAVLAQRLLPYPLANLAVLDAYAGDASLARRRADSAVALAPNDPAVLNNRGVVLFLAGQYEAARTAFTEALRASSENDDAAVLFNLGRAALAVGDTAAGRVSLTGYARADETSGWSQYAAELLKGARGTAPASPQLQSASTSAPPTVAGVTLGAAASEVHATLGPPDSVASAGRRAVWTYARRGVRFVISENEGVLAIILVRADAGNIAGVRVGDSLADVRSRLGQAVDIDGGALLFHRGTWRIVVKHEGGMVSSIAVVAA